MMRLTVVAVCLCVSACTSSILQSKIPTPNIYVLAAMPVDAATVATLPVDLAVARPTAVPGLDSDRIAVLHEERRLDYYQESQWGAALPEVVQSLLVGSLQNQKLFRSVTTEQARVSASYLLDLEIRDFQAEYASDSAPPTVRVTLIGSLIRIKDRKLIGIFPTTFTTTAAANRLGAVVAAFESTARQAVAAMGKQTASTVAATAD